MKQIKANAGYFAHLKNKSILFDNHTNNYNTYLVNVLKNI